MSPVERLQAAIDKLESLQFESTPGVWQREVAGIVAAVEDAETTKIVVGDVLLLDDDAELIVTMQRAIPAVLDVLRDTLSVFRDPIPLFIGHEERIYAHQLDLAGAILGSES